VPGDEWTPWGVVVPVKRLVHAKSRLGAYGDTTRERLALAFAADVVRAALGGERVARVLVVTDDVVAATTLGALGADIAPDSPDDGLNPALAHGADLVRAAVPGCGVACLSADLPALGSAQLDAVLGVVGAGSRAFVTDAQGSGTTLLAAGPRRDLDPAFGAGSRVRHLASGAVELSAAPGLRRDVDTPYDLRQAVALGVGPATRAVLADLPDDVWPGHGARWGGDHPPAGDRRGDPDG
jgi:2-phospho-L-lactate guanylyltransferase